MPFLSLFSSSNLSYLIGGLKVSLVFLNVIIFLIGITFMKKISKTVHSSKKLITKIHQSRRHHHGSIVSDESEKNQSDYDDEVINVLFVIAHPDDEAMFFAPTILSLMEWNHSEHSQKKPKVRIYILCLSSGNAMGIGHVRINELCDSCKILGFFSQEQGIQRRNNSNMNDNQMEYLESCHVIKNVSFMQNSKELGISKSKFVYIIDDESKFPDSMSKIWDVDAVQKVVSHFVDSLDINVIFTFDRFGVSSHPNHISTYQGVKNFINSSRSSSTISLSSSSMKKVSHSRLLVAYELITYGLISKYSGLLNFLIPPSFSEDNSLDTLYFASSEVWKPIEAMKSHYSQYVWYRRLFLIFSTYGFQNTFRIMGKIPTS